MKNPKCLDEGAPLWVAIILLAIFGCTMLMSGYLLGRDC